MRKSKSRFTESQIVAILKEGEAGVALSELTRKHGISRASFVVKAVGQAFHPPSTVRFSPLIKADSGLARKAAADAISSALP